MAKKSSTSQVEPRLLNIKMAAAYLSCTIWALRSLVWKREIPFVRIGQKLLFDRADLDRFVDSKKVAA
jgi:excisionase family DNA binding protein